MTFQLPLLAANARIFAAETAASGGAGIDVAQAAKLSQESDLDKLERYLLNPDHVTGDRRRSGSNETGVTQYGIKYNQVISIAGANGRVIDVPFAWIRGNDGVVRLVTAIPTSK
ncbi:hypothetical protein [Mycobacterium avium]|uniref:hypothetical protein n=1 Tax=Mycobacterium avium TaxID=1764 RepID=UPI001CC4EB9B|nr:hypothetical protein [Mycobacterium avium]MBZ4622099.1 hypothetical protein [Mycobacterium avium subsp. hominissuis]